MNQILSGEFRENINLFLKILDSQYKLLKSSHFIIVRKDLTSQLIARKVQILRNLVENYYSKKKVYYIVEAKKWSISDDGYQITSRIPESRMTTSFKGIKNSLIHFGSINTVPIKNNQLIQWPDKSNKIIITWFHISSDDPRADLIGELDNRIDLWHTSCSITKKELIRRGASEEKIKVIPLGVDLHKFYPPAYEDKKKLRKKFGIPEERIVVGSFQKDGSGWGEGLEPKLIKGPDIFLKVIARLKEDFDIHCLLSGPARGYIKKGLEEMNIPYTHRYYRNPWEVAECFRTCDLYIMASRVEGGPKSILESLASGVPLIATKVGMAPDVLQDGQNAFLAEPDDVMAISEKAHLLLHNPTLTRRFISNGLNKIKLYSWDKIAELYQSELYSKLYFDISFKQ